LPSPLGGRQAVPYRVCVKTPLNCRPISRPSNSSQSYGRVWRPKHQSPSRSGCNYPPACRHRGAVFRLHRRRSTEAPAANSRSANMGLPSCDSRESGNPGRKPALQPASPARARRTTSTISAVLSVPFVAMLDCAERPPHYALPNRRASLCVTPPWRAA